MTKREMHRMVQQMLDVYSGILFNNTVFESGKIEEVVYEFDCPEFEELRSKYNLIQIAGKGSDFVRVKRLLHHLASRLTHSSWYDNHIECNSLRLLEYSFNHPEHGINCLNKSKILIECCLAVGVFARRVSLMPFSPYDFDNHVVVEIYDRTLKKWTMIDPTTDGYFIDEMKIPLSLLEIRDKFAKKEFVTYVPSTSSLKNIEKLREQHVYQNMYICKNLFYFKIEKYSTFGEKNEYLYVVPCRYSIKSCKEANLMYRIKNIPENQENLRELAKKNLAQLEQFLEPNRVDVECMQKKPCGI